MSISTTWNFPSALNSVVVVVVVVVVVSSVQGVSEKESKQITTSLGKPHHTYIPVVASQA